MLLGLSENVAGCMSNPPKVVYFWRIRYRCSSILESLHNLALDKLESPCACRGSLKELRCEFKPPAKIFQRVQSRLFPVLDFPARLEKLDGFGSVPTYFGASNL
ncbi:hypothetical protein A4A49_33182 [Nicotiana attenuata]|uniref:Uncharacterized protein n=1 Tax=Nicotiana attenuata TaxID=49451 RepID=A0A314KQD5_NICAT|nr:hypothetical protein A4A49_33182 [Nicotiana attenuata]